MTVPMDSTRSTPRSAPPPATLSPLHGWSVPTVFVLALALYRAGTAPGLLWGDSAEMQTLAALGGVAHPTGYPLFTLFARALVSLTGGPPAFLANFFSGLFAAVALSLLAAFLLTRGVRTPAVLAAVLAWGLSFTFWTTSHRAEVYSLATSIGIVGLWCALNALEHGGRLPRLASGFLLGLTLAGHMAFAPCVMVTGLTLAWQIPRKGITWLADELALLVAFLLGLTPYLYLLWADSHRVGFDYITLFETAYWPASPVPETFHAPLSRLWWLLTSRNDYPARSFALPLRLLGKNISDTSFLLALFELGPITAVVVATGIVTRWREKAGEARLLLAFGLASIAFSVITSGYKILSVFLIPCYLVCAVFAGHGFDAVFAVLAKRRGVALATAIVLALPLASALIAHSSRLATYEHPLGPFHSSVIEEDDIRQRGLVPTFAGYDEARQFVESAAVRFPDSALVIAEWREVMALTYLQLVEHRRTDLTLQPWGYPNVLARLADWQRRYTPKERPVLIVGAFSPLNVHFDHVDTLRLATGQPVWMARTPLVRLDQPWTPPPPKPRAH